MKSASVARCVALATTLLTAAPAWSGPAGPVQHPHSSRAGPSEQHPGGPVIRLLGSGASEQPRVLGRTYGEWAARWVGWAYSGPVGQNAIQDTTGASCGLNQPPGPVWFLAGTFGGPTVVRECTVPRGRALFYPIVETSWIDCPGTTDDQVPDADVRDLFSLFLFAVPTELSSTVNGVHVASLQVPIVRTQSPAFTSILPNNNVVGGCAAPLPAGKTGRQIADGYWVMLPALPAGQHTLTLRGATPGFETSVTYKLTVR